MNQTSLWQDTFLQHITALLGPHENVLALFLFGSYAKPVSQFDFWSDLDLLLVVKDEAYADFFPSRTWLEPLGNIFAYDQSADAARSTTRICFDDFRRADFVITSQTYFTNAKNWPKLPLHQNIQKVFSRSSKVDQVMLESYPDPVFIPTAKSDIEALTNQFWFKAMLAVQKVMRHDLLIALHLALDLVRDCSVLGMILRDRATRTRYHRNGGMGNDMVKQLAKTQQPYSRLGLLKMIEESSLVFDRLALQWSTDYQEKHQLLAEWIQKARADL